jgi:outer membrane protein
MVRLRLLALTVAACSAASVGARAESLADAIALAYQTSPALLATRADLRALDERYIQARDALGPTASVSEQHASEVANVKQPGYTSSFQPSNVTTRNSGINDTFQVTINQPLYDGGQLSTAIAAAKADVLSGRQALRQEETQVLGQVITAYADVLLAQDLETIARQNVAILRRQMAETQAKVDVKEVTLTDRAQASARLVAAQIQLAQASNQLANARAKYRSVVGQAPGQLDPAPDLPGLPPDLSAALDAADHANPQLLQALDTELASRARVAQAKAADGFQIGLTAQASSQPLAPYLEHELVNGVEGAIVINKTLFTAGAHGSQVRAAIETDNRDQLRMADERRQVISSVIQAWNDLTSQRQILTSLNQQLDEEDKAFEGSRIESRIGLRTTIDVLNAEQEMQATKVSLAQSYHDEYLSRVNLLAGMGVLQVELLDPTLDPYKPEASLFKREAWSRALPWEALVAALDSIAAPEIAHAAPDRDPLGAETADSAGAPLPNAPRWADLAKYLKDEPGKDEPPATPAG